MERGSPKAVWGCLQELCKAGNTVWKEVPLKLYGAVYKSYVRPAILYGKRFP